MQNFCAIFAEQNAKFFFLCASVLREKTTICAIIRKSHFAQNCLIPLLQNSSFAQFCNLSFVQFRNFVKIKRVSYNSILEQSCFGMSSYIWSLLHNWPMTVKIEFKSHNFLDNLSFGHAYFLKVDSSGICYFLAFFYMRLNRFQKCY